MSLQVFGFFEHRDDILHLLCRSGVVLQMHLAPAALHPKGLPVPAVVVELVDAVLLLGWVVVSTPRTDRRWTGSLVGDVQVPADLSSRWRSWLVVDIVPGPLEGRLALGVELHLRFPHLVRDWLRLGC